MLNIRKTKVMKTDKTIGPVDITIDNEMLETVNKYEYLGSTVTENCDGRMGIRRRLAIATNKLMSIKSLWKGESAQTKLKILSTLGTLKGTTGWEGSSWKAGSMGKEDEKGLENSGITKI